jgi:carboxymethylenebutenolidase
MCFEHGSRPPVAPIAGAAVDGRTIALSSADGTRFLGFHASAAEPSGAAMLVLPDVRGLHPYYEELALRFAEAGIEALAVDYFGRTAGTAGRSGDFDYRPHVAQTEHEQLRADISAAAAELRRGAEVRALFSIGFCFGGRLSLLSASWPEVGLEGAVAFYGWPVGPSRAHLPAPADRASEMRCPVLAIFGGDDEGISAEHRAAFAVALEQAGVAHELLTYPGAPHSFFDRKAAQFSDASADAWQKVLGFVRRLTPSDA